MLDQVPSEAPGVAAQALDPGEEDGAAVGAAGAEQGRLRVVGEPALDGGFGSVVIVTAPTVLRI